MKSGIHRAAILHAAAAGVLALSGATFAADTVFVGPSGGTWDADANWRQGGPDLTLGNGDDVFVQPGTADAAIILDGSTVNLSTTETVLEMQVSNPGYVFDTSATHGVARLNILPGAVLTTNGNTSGIRVGRALDVGQAIGSSRGEIVQTGGNVIIQQGANGLRLSQADSGNVADSLYRISGGSLRGGAGADGTMVSDLRIGAVTNVWDEAEFHVVGSAATSIRFLDIQAAANSLENGDSIFHFSLDAGGVTPIVAEDELQFRATNAVDGVGNNLLEIDLIGEAPATDIVLFQADRLNTNGVPSGAANEHFTNLLEGDPVVRQFNNFEYTWTVDYTDGVISGPTVDVVALRFVSKVFIGPAATLYWDINGTTAGAGGATPTGNWDGTAPNFNTDAGGGAGTLSGATTAGDTVVFAAGNGATGAYTVTVSGSRSAALLKVEEGSVTFTGGGTISTPTVEVASGATARITASLAGPANTLTKTGTGTLEVSKLPQGNAMNVNAGTVRILESAPGYGTGHPSGNNAFVSRPSSLTVADGAQLDITNNDVVIDYSGSTPIAAYEALVASGYNLTGDWQGDGIVSSIAANDGNYVVAIADNATLAAPFGTAQGGPLFAGVDVDLDTILIKFTHRADINLDGLITPDDSAIFGGNYDENQPAVWATGDMNYDGVFTPDDAAIFGGAYDESLASLPEPTSLATFGLLGLGLVRRRRRP